MGELEKKIRELAEQNQEKVIQWRRHFHRCPELSFEEFDTSDYIARQLQDMGYEVKRNIGGTGVFADLKTGRPGRAIAFRADMDALPILEETGLDFESEKAGLMHGCGHDGHMAVLLGTAQLLQSLAGDLCGTVRFIFQPGEEANGGARCVINDGALKNPDIEGIFGLHMMPDLPCGTIGIREGHLSATDDEFVIHIHGKSAHSSEPEVGVNAIVAASHVVTALDSVLSNNVGPFQVATFSICQIQGGEAINVIPDSVEMKGMIRCVEKSDKMQIRRRMEAIVEHTAKAFGGSGEIEFIPGFPSVNNDSALTRLTVEAAERVLEHEDDVYHIERPHLGSEDFAYYQEEVSGAMFMLGCAQETGETGSLHSPILNINEDALLYGVRIFAEIAMSMCGRYGCY